MTASDLFLHVVAGSLGVAYVLYGKKKSRIVPIIAGLILCGLPYLMGGVWAWVLCAVLVLAPKFLKEN
jgi:zinc transporter ZupT